MISLGHFNWPIEAAVFNKNHYWASREYADRFWPAAVDPKQPLNQTHRIPVFSPDSAQARGHHTISVGLKAQT